MRAMHRPATILATALVLAACSPASASPSATASQPAPTPVESVEPSAADPSHTAAASLEPVPTEDLRPFTCDLPVVEDPTVTIANLVDVRIGAHADYDRVVFEFAQGTPELTLDRATPPFSEDASGLPLDVDGESFLRLTMRGGTRQTDEGTSSFDGPSDFDPGLETLVDLVQGGDFERQSTWYLGLESDACVRVILLESPDRVVIDVEH